jgi:hypothetical protein
MSGRQLYYGCLRGSAVVTLQPLCPRQAMNTTNSQTRVVHSPRPITESLLPTRMILAAPDKTSLVSSGKRSRAARLLSLQAICSPSLTRRRGPCSDPERSLSEVGCRRGGEVNLSGKIKDK